MTSKSKKPGKKRRAEDVAESESDSSADEQDLEAFHRRMNEDADQEAGGRLMPASSSDNGSDSGDGDVDTSEVDTDELSSEEDGENDDAYITHEESTYRKKNTAALDAKAAKMRRLKESLETALSSGSSSDDDEDSEEEEEEGSDGEEDEEAENADKSLEGQGNEDDESAEDDAGESIQERAEAAGAEKRGTKRLKAKRSPALTKADSPPSRKKMAKVEAAAVKVPDYANMQEADDESARRSIRSELKSMSIEEMQKLKEEIGLKLFNKAVKGDSGDGAKEEKRRRHFPRDNKNRPREMSAKRTVARFRDVVGVSGELAEREANKRDPRFDSLCGTFDQKLFRDSYKFVDSIRSDERKKLASELAEETDPEQIKKIKYLIQRYDNQMRERDRLEKSRSARDAERAERKRALREEGGGGGGEVPSAAAVYTSKREAKNRELVAKFEELQKGGKLDNYVRRKNKKIAAKDRKRMRNS